ncbi:DUF6003 family protein [Streptomyces sp. NPDC020817]|uniref:DUF6003 family protein n=1 Tax=Streptomyces sp. NPDC020817 TaxID=3365095 RepID=UPI003796A92A
MDRAPGGQPAVSGAWAAGRGSHPRERAVLRDRPSILGGPRHSPGAGRACCEGGRTAPGPLSEEELERVRRATATDRVAGIEEEMLPFRGSEENRDELLRRALAAGVPAHRIAELSVVDPTTLSSPSLSRTPPAGRADPRVVTHMPVGSRWSSYRCRAVLRRVALRRASVILRRRSGWSAAAADRGEGGVAPCAPGPSTRWKATRRAGTQSTGGARCAREASSALTTGPRPTDPAGRSPAL